MNRLTDRHIRILWKGIAGLLLVLLIPSCEEVIDIELNDPDHQRIVVEGRILTEYGPQYIRLTQTLSYFDHETAPVLRDIEAKIIEEGSGIEFPLVLADDSLGIYKTPDMAGKVGETYRLEIRHDNQIYQARAFLDTVPDIDSARVEHIVYRYFGIRIGLYSFRANFFEPAPEGNFYSARVYLNDTLYTKTAAEAVYFTDMQMSGRYWYDAELFTIPDKDITLNTNTVRIELYSISEDEFNFLIGLFSESYGNGNIYTGPPANIPTNILNQSDGIDGTGFFGASDKVVFETVFLKQHQTPQGGFSP